MRASGLTLAGLAAISLSLAGCSKQHTPAASMGLPIADEAGPLRPGTHREFSERIGDTVRFETDRSDLTPQARAILVAQAQWLRQYPHFPVLIEGHADERGTREYNIALGARRAEAVRTFLAANGVPANRIRTVSYGKERPVAICDDISCWSQNRRAVTVLSGPATASF